MASRTLTAIELVNGSTGDPSLYLDYPGSDNAILFDAGDNCRLSMKQLMDLEAIFITHHHVDHFVGLDRIIRANLDRDKTLKIYGPMHSIQRIYDRVKSYDYPFFPFMQLEIEVRELLDKKQRVGRFGCSSKFATLDVEEVTWKGTVCYETEFLKVEAIPVVHSVPCWAYALIESGGWHPDPEKLIRGMLKHGNWVGEALRMLRENTDQQTLLDIQGGQYSLGKLAELAFTQTDGSRITYITDTFYSDELRPQLVKLAKGASKLYCDSFYAKLQAKDAAKHQHMMAYQAAEIALKAKVEQLVLIHHATRYAGRYDLLLAEASEIFPRVTHII